MVNWSESNYILRDSHGGQTSQARSHRLDIPLLNFSSASETPCPTCVFHSFKDVSLNALCVLVLVLALNQHEVNYELVDGKNKNQNLKLSLAEREVNWLLLSHTVSRGPLPLPSLITLVWYKNCSPAPQSGRHLPAAFSSLTLRHFSLLCFSICRDLVGGDFTGWPIACLISGIHCE